MHSVPRPVLLLVGSAAGMAVTPLRHAGRARASPAMLATADQATARLASSVEVTASKIFPAGAGWQLASIVADNAGFASTALPFFATVGLGDCAGVFLGHVGWQLVKSKLKGAELDLGAEMQVGSLLGGAAFFSGFTWQIALNAFNKLGLTFTQSLGGVGLATTAAFFLGLRVMRRLLSPLMPAVAMSDYGNMKSDVGLAAAVGAGCAGFVGTDLSFGAANWLAPLVGIKDSFSSAAACVVAGCSTSLGFMAAMAVQAVGLDAKQCWIDADFEHRRAKA